MANKYENTPAKTVELLFRRISLLIAESRKLVASSINTVEVCTKFQIGRLIVEEEQKGRFRAEYGKQVLSNLSERLMSCYENGWTVDTLKRCRYFYRIYCVQRIGATLLPQSEVMPTFTLSWSHYLVLMRIKNDEERRFYEIEATSGNWSVRELQRQYAIINKLQDFLLELGKGFLFEARQKRFSFDEDNYYVDLVLYNRLLQCYVLVDLKVDKLSHQDLGQMQMYVNYYDRYVKQNFEKPTIGILLCKEKKDALVSLTLPQNANIYASAYELYLPDKKLLQAKVKEWIDEFEKK